MTCTHCSATIYTCQGYLRQINADGTLPLVYACYPSCQGFTSDLFPPRVPPARSPWRDRRTDPPPAEDDTPILVVEEVEDPSGRRRQTPIVLYWFGHDGEWVDAGCDPRCWVQWQPIELPPFTEAGWAIDVYPSTAE